VATLAGADAAAAAGSLAGFPGVHRRLELLGETPEGAPVYDDYAHNPTKIAAAIDAVRTFGPRRVVAVFQPHRFSRTAALFRPLGAALTRADLVVVLDVYPAGERAEDYPGVKGLLVAAAASEHASGRQVAWLPGFDEARAFLETTLRPGDLCLVMGAGNIDDLGRLLVSGCEPIANRPVPADAPS
jgi:UDP-N-acetylmuramate--alanine ligase